MTGLLMVPLGTWLLFMGDMSVVRIITGMFFASFASYLLVKSFVEEGREKRPVVALPPSAAAASPINESPTATLEPSKEARSVSGVTNSGQGTKGFIPWPEPEEEEGVVLVKNSTPCGLYSRLKTFVNTRLLPLSERASPFRACMTLLVSGVGAGFFNGRLGVGGPPQMIAFALLSVHKDLVRGVAVSYGMLEIPVRLTSFLVNSGSKGLDGKESVLGLVAVASVSGFFLGTYLRRFADTRLILRLMLLLTLLGAAIMVKALEFVSVGAAFLLYATSLGIVLALIRFKGLWV